MNVRWNGTPAELDADEHEHVKHTWPGIRMDRTNPCARSHRSCEAPPHDIGSAAA